MFFCYFQGEEGAWTMCLSVWESPLCLCSDVDALLSHWHDIRRWQCKCGTDSTVCSKLNSKLYNFLCLPMRNVVKFYLKMLS